MEILGPKSCADCPVGAASGVGKGGYCAFVDRTRKAGEILYLEGAESDYVWFIKRGTVALYREHNDAEAAVRAVRFAGSFIGLETLVSPTYLDTAKASTEVVLCGASAAGIDNWLGAKGSPARTALEITLRSEHADRIRRAPRDGSAVSRVADWLSSEGPRGVALTLPRQIVADLLGMRPETLSRALATLRERGAIAADRTSITILDETLLDQAAHGA